MSIIDSSHNLIEQICKDPSHENWEEFLLYYGPYIRAILRHYDDLESQAIEQKIFLKLWENLSKFYFDEKVNFSSWVALLIHDYLGSQNKKLNHQNNILKQGAGIKPINDKELIELQKIATNEWRLFIIAKALNNVKSQVSHKMYVIFIQASVGKKAPQIAWESGLMDKTVQIYLNQMEKKLVKEIRRISHFLDKDKKG